MPGVASHQQRPALFVHCCLYAFVCVHVMAELSGCKQLTPPVHKVLLPSRMHLRLHWLFDLALCVPVRLPRTSVHWLTEALACRSSIKSMHAKSGKSTMCSPACGTASPLSTSLQLRLPSRQAAQAWPAPSMLAALLALSCSFVLHLHECHSWAASRFR